VKGPPQLRDFSDHIGAHPAADFQVSEANLIDFVRVRSNTKLHLPI
jgi:hypothetical protein